MGYWIFGINEQCDIFVSVGQMSKSSEIIAGKQCNVYTWRGSGSSPFGGKSIASWGNNVFMDDVNDGSFQTRASQASDSPPGSAFAKNFNVW
jgi:hypothetical protein